MWQKDEEQNEKDQGKQYHLVGEIIWEIQIRKDPITGISSYWGPV